MNFLKIAAIFSVVSGFGLRGQGEGYDHESLTTAEGRVFHEIFVLGSDPAGLTFRHRAGIAKVSFSSLSPAYRMLYEPVEDLPGGDGAAPGEAAAPAPAETDQTAFADDWVERLDEGPVRLEARNRIVAILPIRALWLGGGIDHDRREPAWPSWWPRHEEVHRLTHPLYRELALRDFLYCSGLLPQPWVR